MKAILSGLALSTAIFAAHAAPPVVDREAQTVTFKNARTGLGTMSAIHNVKILDCRFGTLSHLSGIGGASMVDVAVAVAVGNPVRSTTARKLCEENGLKPGF